MSDPITGTLAVLILAAQWRWWTAPRWRRRQYRAGADLIPALRELTGEHRIVSPHRPRVVAGRLRHPARPSHTAGRRAGVRLHHHAAHHAAQWRPRRLRTAVAV